MYVMDILRLPSEVLFIFVKSLKVCMICCYCDERLFYSSNLQALPQLYIWGALALDSREWNQSFTKPSKCYWLGRSDVPKCSTLFYKILTPFLSAFAFDGFNRHHSRLVKIVIFFLMTVFILFYY